jgi:hypothetical protein
MRIRAFAVNMFEVTLSLPTRVLFSGPTLLAFAYVMQECGALFGTVLVALSGVMAVFSGEMLMEAADERGTTTYDTTVSNVMGRAGGIYIHLSVIGVSVCVALAPSASQPWTASRRVLI